MIIEAFASYLHANNPGIPARAVLAKWLLERLTSPAQNNVDRVIRSEIALKKVKKKKSVNSDLGKEASKNKIEEKFSFEPLSVSGQRLLDSLYEYAMSYEQQKWSRWVHVLKASDFKKYKQEIEP